MSRPEFLRGLGESKIPLQTGVGGLQAIKVKTLTFEDLFSDGQIVNLDENLPGGVLPTGSYLLDVFMQLKKAWAPGIAYLTIGVDYGGPNEQSLIRDGLGADFDLRDAPFNEDDNALISGASLSTGISLLVETAYSSPGMAHLPTLTKGPVTLQATFTADASPSQGEADIWIVVQLGAAASGSSGSLAGPGTSVDIGGGTFANKIGGPFTAETGQTIAIDWTGLGVTPGDYAVGFYSPSLANGSSNGGSSAAAGTFSDTAPGTASDWIAFISNVSLAFEGTATIDGTWTVS